MRLRGAITISGVAFALAFSVPSQASAELDCASIADTYNLRIADYNQATNPPKSQFDELKRVKKETERNRQDCVREINQQFKATIQEINSRFPKQSRGNNKDAVDRAQRSAEIAAATMERDTKIGQIPIIQELPEQKKFVKVKNQKGTKR